MKILFDTNVVLDVLLRRRPFYEDAVLVEAALMNSLDAVVTRTAKDFKNTPLNVFVPKELLDILAARQ